MADDHDTEYRLTLSLQTKFAKREHLQIGGVQGGKRSRSRIVDFRDRFAAMLDLSGDAQLHVYRRPNKDEFWTEVTDSIDAE